MAGVLETNGSPTDPARCNSRSLGTTSGLQNCQSNESFGNAFPSPGWMTVPSRSALCKSRCRGRRSAFDSPDSSGAPGQDGSGKSCGQHYELTECGDAPGHVRIAPGIVSAAFASHAHAAGQSWLPLANEDRFLRSSFWRRTDGSIFDAGSSTRSSSAPRIR